MVGWTTEMDGRVDGWMNEQMDGWVHAQMESGWDGWTDVQMGGRIHMNKWRVGKRTSVEWVDGQVDGWVDASMGVCGWAYGQAESGWTDGALTLPGSSSWRGVPVAGRVDSAVLNNLCRLSLIHI